MRASLPALLALLVSCGPGPGAPDGGAATDDAGTPDRDGGGPAGDGGVAIPDGGSGAPDAGPGPAPQCGRIDTFETGRTPTRRLHVGPGGSDATGDGSEALPFASLGRAAREATPGTAVTLHAGTYPGGQYVANLSGTAEAPIWIGGAPGETRPVLEGAGQGLHLSRVRYLVLHDLEVRGSANNGINCDDGGDYGDPEATRFVVFRDLFIHDVGAGGNEDCLKLSGVRDFFVLDSEIAACGSGGSGIDQVGCHRGLIARNHLHDLNNAVQTKGGTEDVEIRWNRIEGQGSRALNLGGSTGFQYFRPPLSTTAPNVEARDVRAVANLIVGFDTPLAFVGCVGCLAANNTLVNPTRWLMRILQETTSTAEYTFLPASDTTLVNNLFYFSRSALSTYVNVGPSTAPETFAFQTNLWYAHDDPARSAPDLPVAETGGITGEDPGFTGAGFHLGPQSPAAGSGSPQAAVEGDLEGRCYADPPAIGAYSP